MTGHPIKLSDGLKPFDGETSVFKNGVSKTKLDVIQSEDRITSITLLD